ncbi:hypothetical protein [Citrobacter europaeus]|uniref:hypothetical protein n=1 Tax=Citrobacter europaeus TaxID=1914243 RepID=UPI0039C06B4C
MMEFFVHAQSNEQGRHELHVSGCSNINTSLEPVALGEFVEVKDAARHAEKMMYLPLSTCECCGVSLDIEGTPSVVMENILTSNF